MSSSSSPCIGNNITLYIVCVSIEMTQILDIKNKEFYSWTYHCIFFRIVQFVFWTDNIINQGCKIT